MLSHYIVCDVSTAPLENCEQWIEPGEPPSNYTKPDSIAKWKAETRLELIERAALDMDLARVTGIAIRHCDADEPMMIWLCKNEEQERETLQAFASIGRARGYPLVGFNSLKFDWPMLVQRALWLNVDLQINTDRFKSPHLDVSDYLTRKGMFKAKSLDWYCRRHGWDDLCPKPMSGEQESKVFQTGEWALLEESLRRDVIATHRLGVWAKQLQQPVPAMDATQLEVGF